MKKHKKIAIRNQLNKEIKTILGSLIAIVLIAFGIYYFTQNKTEEVADVTNSSKVPANLTREFNHKKGPDNAKIKIVEFYDPECEACAAFFPYVKEILFQYKDDIQLTARYALYHGNSELAAKASEASALQGKFWEFQELLFLNQKEWSHSKIPSTDKFIKYAKDLDLNISKFMTDMNDLKRMETISIDVEDGKKIGINGTPTFYVNGKLLENLNPVAFRSMIEQELASGTKQ